MDQESEWGLRTGNRGPEIGNRKKDPESGTGRIEAGKGTRNREQELGIGIRTGIGNRILESGSGTRNREQETGPGIGNRKLDMESGPGNRTVNRDRESTI